MSSPAQKSHFCAFRIIFLVVFFKHLPIGESLSIYNISRDLTNFIFSTLPEQDDMSTEGLAKAKGFPIETHHVHTEDGN